MNKLILNIPHASIQLPSLDGYVINEEELSQEILLLTDRYTDDLFCSPDDYMIVADFSRIFCDIERFVDDEVEVMSKYGMGVLYRKTDNGKEMRQFSEIYKKHIIKTYYDKHHLALSKSVKSELAKNRKALIIDCHSFSDTPFKRDLNQDKNRPDICIGTDPFHTSKKLLTLTKDFFANYKYSIEINNPYSGSLVPTEFYTKNKNVLSIMIELNRNLYLQPGTKQKSENYDSVKTMISSYLDFIKGSVI